LKGIKTCLENTSIQAAEENIKFIIILKQKTVKQRDNASLFYFKSSTQSSILIILFTLITISILLVLLLLILLVQY